MKFTVFVGIYVIGIVLQSVRADDKDHNSHKCAQPIFKLGKDQVACFAEIPRWGHNHATGECDEFSYDGCNKNDNHFEKKEDCEKECGEWHKQHKDHSHGEHGHDETDCKDHKHDASDHHNHHSHHNHHHH